MEIAKNELFQTIWLWKPFSNFFLALPSSLARQVLHLLHFKNLLIEVTFYFWTELIHTRFFDIMFDIWHIYWRCILQCMSLYWASSSTFGLLQNVAMKLPRVRRACRIPLVQSESQTPFQDIARNFKAKYLKLSCDSWLWKCVANMLLLDELRYYWICL